MGSQAFAMYSCWIFHVTGNSLEMTPAVLLVVQPPVWRLIAVDTACLVQVLVV